MEAFCIAVALLGLMYFAYRGWSIILIAPMFAGIAALASSFGIIAYIEMDGDPTKNVKAFEAIVRAMHDNDMGYFSINHPVDRDPVCGYTGIIENECPHCHRKEIERGHIVIPRMKA